MVEYLPLKVVAAMDDVVLFPLFPVPWSRYTAVSRGLETQPALVRLESNHPSSMIMIFLKLERFCYQGPSKSLLPVAANMC